MTATNTEPTTINSPPSAETSPTEWLRENLFSTWYNSLLTLILFGIIIVAISNLLEWALNVAQWEVLKVNWPLFFTGIYPRDQYWRLWIDLGLVCSLSGLSWGVIARNAATLFDVSVLISLATIPALLVLIPATILSKLLLVGMVLLVVASAWIGKQLGRKKPSLAAWLPLAWFVAFFISLWLIGGGLGLEEVSTSKWGGLTLTMLMAVVSIVLCFPLGVLLALGRQSQLPAIRGFSIGYIEIIRGLPLISILFMGQVMIPMFLPEGVRPDRVLRAIVGLTMFSAAYLAENVRGGLQSIPKGQSEAAKALGFKTPLVVSLIVLPQALKVAIPAIVGQFISLFQDTTLLAIVGLRELLGISRSVLAQPDFLGDYAEVYLFNGVIFWLFCYAMSLASRQLEKKLNTGNK
ncbi:MAG: amino acid ABC transporter permease [Cyanobacteriota bacterium]|nr:amino acid ABC transporter permease [Cyanobacteriota bacterium]